MELFLLFAMVIILMLIGVPIAVSLGFSSIVFLLIFSDSSLASVAQTIFEAFEGHSTLLAIPFFILASSFMSTGGVAKRIIRFSIALVGLVSMRNATSRHRQVRRALALASSWCVRRQRLANVRASVTLSGESRSTSVAGSSVALGASGAPRRAAPGRGSLNLKGKFCGNR